MSTTTTQASEGPILEVEDLHVSYRGVPAVRGVGFTVGRGEIVALLGANGAGKSTTLKALMGLVGSSVRRVTFDGVDVGGKSPEQLVRLGMTLTPEGRRVFGGLTVAENLRLGRAGRGGHTSPIDDDAELLDLFPILKQRQDQLAGTMSGGEQQQLAIARSLMSGPKLLMLDEPSLGVAPRIVDIIMDLIVTLRERGITVLLVEQNVTRSLEIADRAYVLGNGQVVHHGTGVELLAEEDALVRTYLGVGDAPAV